VNVTGMLYYKKRLYVPNLNSIKNLILDEFHKSHYARVMKPTQEKIEKIYQRLRIHPFQGGNLLYIT